VQTSTAPSTAQTISLTTTNSSTSIQTSSQTNMANECANPSSGWIFCDDFETDRLTRYFEYVTANNSFTRLSGIGVGSSTAMKAQYQPGQSSAGNLKLAFGKTPDPYFKPVDNGLNRYREIYWRVYVKNQSGWTGGGGDKLSRAIVFANNNWAEAAIGHVWSGGPNSNYLLLDPTSGTDTAGNLQTTQYNDGANFRWLGYAQSSTPIFDSAHVGQWQCVEAHMKLNDSGQSNGVFELFVNGQLEVQRAGLNWVGSYSDYGINTIFVENYWNNSSPVVQERYIDNFVVSTQKIGCGTLPNTSSPSTSSPSTTVNPPPSTSSTPTPTVVSSPSPTTNPTTTQSSATTPTQGTTVPVLSRASAPFGGVPRTIPGRIEAEDFDTGGEGVAYHDMDAINNGGQYRLSEGVDIQTTSDSSGYKLGWTQAGEWLQYTVNVTAAGTYTLGVRVSSGIAVGGTFHVEFNGANKTGPMTIPNTGDWENLQTVTKTVSLSAGVQVMRLVFDTNAAYNYMGNFNYIDVVTAPTVASTPSTTSTPTSTSTPVSFQGTGREAICSNPAVWACYDFEDGKLGPFTGGNFNISTTVKRGNYALDMFYPAVPNRPGSNGGSGFGGPTRGGAGTQEWHMRWYTYFTPNWVTGGFQKGWIIGDGNHPAAISSIYVMNHDYANPNPETLVQSLTLGQVLNPLSSPDSHLYLPNNLRAFPFTGSNLGRWVSVEVHIKLNTPGVYHDNRRNNDVWPGRAIYPPDTVRHPGDGDGIYEAWIDGVKVAEYVNINYRGTLAGSYQDFILSGQWNCTGPPEAGENTCGPLTTSPHPDMHRYIDNIVIADGDTMIGP
jgi:hypothetical protein